LRYSTITPLGCPRFILDLFGIAATTFMVAVNLAAWHSSTDPC
jgi:hypothetical protein